MCNWQRVEDGLPPVGTGEQLVLYIHDNKPRWTKAWFIHGADVWEDNSGLVIHNVTHWATVELPGE